MTDQKLAVTVLGTGIMGAGVARSLLRGGFAVTVWNRDRAKAEQLEADGARVAFTPADAVTDAAVVLTVLFDADAVIDVMTDAAASIRVDAIWLQCSTIGLDGTRRAGEFALERALALVDAPMLGTKAPAEQGTLTMLVSGDPVVIDRAHPVFDAIGAKTLVAGERVGEATALKLATNAWIQTITAAVAQSLALAQALGIDADLFLRAIEGSASDSAYAHLKGAAMLRRDYSASFTVDGVIKDLGVIEAAALSSGVDESLLAAVRASFENASDAGHGSDDMAAVFESFRAVGTAE